MYVNVGYYMIDLDLNIDLRVLSNARVGVSGKSVYVDEVRRKAHLVSARKP